MRRESLEGGGEGAERVDRVDLRGVPLRTRVIEALADSGRLGPGKAPDGLLFPSHRGEPIDLHNWRERYWKPAAMEAGFVEVVEVERRGKRVKVGKATRTPYVMRHTYAAWALATLNDLVMSDPTTLSSVIERAREWDRPIQYIAGFGEDAYEGRFETCACNTFRYEKGHMETCPLSGYLPEVVVIDDRS